MTVRVTAPSGVDISSEKVDKDRLSSIDGFSSGDTGFDIAIGFMDQDTNFVEMELRVRELERERRRDGEKRGREGGRATERQR